MKRVFVPLFLVAVFFSGFCSLVYQLIWDRLARYNFGGDNISATIVVTTFLLGLGVGAYLFRKPFSRPLLAYGLVEAGIGLFAISSYHIIGNISLVTAQVFSATPEGLEGIRIATIAGCAAFLLPPCILMGGTLPMMFAAFFNHEDVAISRVGFIYGLNILGAMTGTTAVPYLLLNNFTIDNVLVAVGCINIAIGMLSISLQFTNGVSRKVPDATTDVPSTGNRGQYGDHGHAGFFPVIAFITGSLTIIYEVMLIRHSFMMIPSSVYNISFVMLSVLFSLGAGSIIIPRLVAKYRIATMRMAGILLMLSAAGMTLSLYASQYVILHRMMLPDLQKMTTTAVYYILITFPLFFPLGAIFPLLCADHSANSDSLSRETGKLYLLNSLGALSGALLFHLVMSAWWGVHGSFLALLVVMLIAGVTALLFSYPKSVAAGAAVLAACLIAALSLLNVRPFLIGPAVNSFANFSIVEGSSGVASANWYDKIGNGALVSINGQGMGAIPNEPYDMRVFSATLAISNPRRVLILGVATGSYIPPILMRRETESLTLVDWSHEIAPLMKTDHIFVKGKEMDALLSDPRVKFIVADARIAVTLFRENSFDLVIDTLARPDWPGATGLRSTAYFKKIARILTPDGHLILGTLYRGWRNASWSETAWRNEIISSLMQSFDHIQENKQALALIASKNDIVKNNPGRIHQIAKEYAPRVKMDEKQLGDVLSNGFVAVSRKDIGDAVPFSENSVQSEYYYKTSDIVAFLFK